MVKSSSTSSSPPKLISSDRGSANLPPISNPSLIKSEGITSRLTVVLSDFSSSRTSSGIFILYTSTVAEKDAVRSILGPHSLKFKSSTSNSTSRSIHDQSASSAEQISLSSESRIACLGSYELGSPIEIERSSAPFVLSTRTIEPSPVAV